MISSIIMSGGAGGPAGMRRPVLRPATMRTFFLPGMGAALSVNAYLPSVIFPPVVGPCPSDGSNVMVPASIGLPSKVTFPLVGQPRSLQAEQVIKTKAADNAGSQRGRSGRRPSACDRRSRWRLREEAIVRLAEFNLVKNRPAPARRRRACQEPAKCWCGCRLGRNGRCRRPTADSLRPDACCAPSWSIVGSSSC